MEWVDPNASLWLVDSSTVLRWVYMLLRRLPAPCRLAVVRGRRFEPSTRKTGNAPTVGRSEPDVKLHPDEASLVH